MTNNDESTGIDTAAYLREKIAEFRTAMLITSPADGAPRPRPMRIADQDGSDLWFVTSKDTDLVTELENNAACSVAMQNSSTYVALRGLVQMHDDIGRMRALWSETMRPWFPHGPSSPDIMLIQFAPLDAEYWDMSGLRLAKMLFHAAKAYAQGKVVDYEDPRLHADVTL